MQSLNEDINSLVSVLISSCGEKVHGVVQVKVIVAEWRRSSRVSFSKWMRRRGTHKSDREQNRESFPCFQHANSGIRARRCKHKKQKGLDFLLNETFKKETLPEFHNPQTIRKDTIYQREGEC